MKKPLIIIGGGLAVVIAIVAIGAVVLWSNLDSIVEAAIERVGSDATQAEVAVEGVELDITGGAGAIRGLSVGNPAGFDTAEAMSLDAITLALDTTTVTADPIVINEITVTGPQLTYELTRDGNNIGALRQNVQDYAQRMTGGGQQAQPAEDEGPGRKLIIKRLAVRGGQVTIRAPMIGDNRLSQPLPEVVLTNIGERTGGAHAAEVARQVFAALSEAVGKAVAESQLRNLIMQQGGDLAKQLQGALGAGLGEGGGMMEGLKLPLENLQQNMPQNMPSGGGEEMKKQLEGAGEQLKGILGR